MGQCQPICGGLSRGNDELDDGYLDNQIKNLHDIIDPMTKEQKDELADKFHSDDNIKKLQEEPIYSAKDMIDIDKEKVKMMD